MQTEMRREIRKRRCTDGSKQTDADTGREMHIGGAQWDEMLSVGGDVLGEMRCSLWDSLSRMYPLGGTRCSRSNEMHSKGVASTRIGEEAQQWEGKY